MNADDMKKLTWDIAEAVSEISTALSGMRVGKREAYDVVLPILARYVPVSEESGVREFAAHCKELAKSCGGPEPQVPGMASGSAWERRVLDEWKDELAEHWTIDRFGEVVHKLYRLAEVVEAMFRATQPPTTPTEEGRAAADWLIRQLERLRNKRHPSNARSGKATHGDEGSEGE